MVSVIAWTICVAGRGWQPYFRNSNSARKVAKCTIQELRIAPVKDCLCHCNWVSYQHGCGEEAVKTKSLRLEKIFGSAIDTAIELTPATVRHTRNARWGPARCGDARTTLSRICTGEEAHGCTPCCETNAVGFTGNARILAGGRRQHHQER